jgi:hypothetical protein
VLIYVPEKQSECCRIWRARGNIFFLKARVSEFGIHRSLRSGWPPTTKKNPELNLNLYIWALLYSAGLVSSYAPGFLPPAVMLCSQAGRWRKVPLALFEEKEIKKEIACSGTDLTRLPLLQSAPCQDLAGPSLPFLLAALTRRTPHTVLLLSTSRVCWKCWDSIVPAAHMPWRCLEILVLSRCQLSGRASPLFSRAKRVLTVVYSFFFLSTWCGHKHWRTLTINVGGAKINYMVAEGANSKYFLFRMVKNDKY